MARKRILVVDDLSIYRDPIALALEAEGYKVEKAVDGLDAIKVVERSMQGFDLMIVDYSMPQLDGLGFIYRAKGYAHMSNVPSLMLTDMADKEIVVKAMQLGIKDYVLKSSFSMPSLLEKVRKEIGEVNEANKKTKKSEVNEVHKTDITPHKEGSRGILQTLKEYIEANPIPKSVNQIISLAESEDSSSLQLAKVIESEPMLATKILKLANSSVYQRADRAVLTIEEAVSKIGFDTIKNIATSAFFCVLGTKESNKWRTDLSYHSYGVALLMHHFCEGTQLAPLAHIIGLCHDLPELILGLAFPKEHKNAMEKSAGDQTKFRKNIESALGVKYLELSSTIFSELKISPPIADPILEFYGKRSSKSKGQYSPVLRLAHSYANALGFFTHSDSRMNIFSNEFVSKFDAVDADSSSFLTSIKATVSETLELLDIKRTVTSSPDKDSIKHIIYLTTKKDDKKNPLRIWLSQNSNLSLESEATEALESGKTDFVIVSSLNNIHGLSKEILDIDTVKIANELKIPVIAIAPNISKEPIEPVDGIKFEDLPINDVRLKAILEK